MILLYYKVTLLTLLLLYCLQAITDDVWTEGLIRIKSCSINTRYKLIKAILYSIFTILSSTILISKNYFIYTNNCASLFFFIAEEC